jgi:hypothetical protein
MKSQTHKGRRKRRRQEAGRDKQHLAKEASELEHDFRSEVQVVQVECVYLLTHALLASGLGY